ncbi:MAG: mucoidy inhibitor MuiA family protein [Planctomycetota bacterium]
MRVFSLSSCAAVAAFSLTLTSPLLAQEVSSTPGVIDAVTVYRGQALVTREIPVSGDAGLREIVVTDLPVHIVSSSMYAESPDGLEIRSIRYRERAVQADVRDDVRVIDETIASLQRAIEVNRNDAGILDEQRAYLRQLETFTAQTATAELTTSVLDPADLKEMTAFLFAERKALATSRLELEQQARDLNAQIATLKHERNLLTDTSSRTAREAIVFVNVPADTAGTVRLRYLVENASWSPSYTVRALSDADDMTVEYSASVRQRSGEAWNNVELTLSTAFPSLTAEAPDLTPLSVVLQQIAPQGVFQPEAYARRRGEIMQQQRVLGAGRAAVVMEKSKDLNVHLAEIDRGLNDLAGQLQVLELGAAIATNDMVGGQAIVVDSTVTEGLSVSYDLDGRLSLPSRSDQQLLRIAQVDLDASIAKLASPVLTDFIYEQAEAMNESGMVFLAGPVASYMDGRFVGNGDLPTVAAGESFDVGFGIDSSLRARRELVNSTETVQGGNKIVEFTYRLVVENFNGGAVPLQLQDRMPTSDGADLRVTFLDSSIDHALNADGIVRWNVDVPAGSGDDAFVVTYTFRMEHDKQMILAGS